MIIKKVRIRNFGKISDTTLELSPGINVLYGENESGKTTVHTFIKSMFFGLPRGRGKAAKTDSYSIYEPWENPTVYGGSIWLESQNKLFRLTRNFHKTSQTEELLCETDGEILDVQQGDLSVILGGVSEVVYENTVSVAQLKSVTGPDLVKELQNYMASYQGTGDHAIDLGRTMQMLKMSRKGYQVQADRRQKDIDNEKNKLIANMSFIKKELENLREQNDGNLKTRQDMLMGLDENKGERFFEERTEELLQEKRTSFLLMIGALVLGIGIGAILSFVLELGLFGLIPPVIAFAAAVLLYRKNRRLDQEYKRYRRLKAKWTQKREKFKWNQDSIRKAYMEKYTAFENLAEEYQEYDRLSMVPGAAEKEVDALNLAMETIEKLSGNRNHMMGEALRRRTSQILGEITGGRYTEVLMDDDFHMKVNTEERIIGLGGLSRGTLEQIYFSLRMAAGELLLEEPLPVILDDVFGMYDEERLTSVLHWLYKEQKQIIISTCHRREEEILQKENIPYQRFSL
ncbi:MAG: AAA family ATPase [Blautia sp.]|nr:AAA family ATPase [Blautia sp.]